MQEGDRATRVLVTGAKGQLGSRLVEFGTRRRALHVVGLDQTDLDITDPSSIQDALAKHTPDVVVNAAAYTAVDLAESEPERAFDINGQGVKHLAEACSQNGVALIHVSTDYVFGEVERVPWPLQSPPAHWGSTAPANSKGKRRFGERRPRCSGPGGVVVRRTRKQLSHDHAAVGQPTRPVEGGERPTWSPHFRPSLGGGVA